MQLSMWGFVHNMKVFCINSLLDDFDLTAGWISLFFVSLSVVTDEFLTETSREHIQIGCFIYLPPFYRVMEMGLYEGYSTVVMWGLTLFRFGR